jgi:hypothetical protein
MPVIALLFTVRDFMQGYNGTGYRPLVFFICLHLENVLACLPEQLLVLPQVKNNFRDF